MKIAIAGTGYIGLSSGILLAQHNEAVALNIIPEKVSSIWRSFHGTKREQLKLSFRLFQVYLIEFDVFVKISRHMGKGNNKSRIAV